MRNIVITPGGKKFIVEAEELFGKERVQGGIFKDPINISNLTDAEVEDALEWFQGQGLKVAVSLDNDKPITLP
jgi:hypothetical protein